MSIPSDPARQIFGADVVGVTRYLNFKIDITNISGHRHHQCVKMHRKCDNLYSLY